MTASELIIVPHAGHGISPPAGAASTSSSATSSGSALAATAASGFAAGTALPRLGGAAAAAWVAWVATGRASPGWATAPDEGPGRWAALGVDWGVSGRAGAD